MPKSSENISVITLEFEYGYDIDVLTNDVRDKLDMVSSELPDEVNMVTQIGNLTISGTDIPAFTDRLFAITGVDGTSHHASNPVSYTHLDVYKRQHLYHPKTFPSG